MSGDIGEPNCNYTKSTRRLGRISQVASLIIGILGLGTPVISYLLVHFEVLEINIAIARPATSESEPEVIPTPMITAITPSPEPNVTPSSTATPIPTTTPSATVSPTPYTTSAPAQPAVLINDNPVLVNVGDTGAWCIPTSTAARTGFRESFRFTFAKGQNEDGYDTKAEWKFDDLDGNYLVEAWIPNLWAEATVTYNVYADMDGDTELVDTAELDQSSEKGWQQLGEYDFSGQARIEIENSNTPNDYREDGTAASRIAADAIRLTLDAPASSTEANTVPALADADDNG